MVRNRPNGGFASSLGARVASNSFFLPGSIVTFVTTSLYRGSTNRISCSPAGTEYVLAFRKFAAGPRYLPSTNTPARPGLTFETKKPLVFCSAANGMAATARRAQHQVIRINASYRFSNNDRNLCYLQCQSPPSVGATSVGRGRQGATMKVLVSTVLIGA